ncbi:cytochrome c oxidase subunit 3 family protein [Pseudothauera nasutitermitis]|uniref:Cytochrome c oxidase subunit 3 family protein n=1 Tax=Pseudothauera nasutitermitis TaxID=2565930 RepID=A0A4V3WC35_9RHOO|nr:cytochrome c oxidase subunit 3 family protein [Pseudothauera nasutitermitis]THF65575.1 cytochrome c oxidase subunit 3 family protein [Pseudothauera nasutitermitis]
MDTACTTDHAASPTFQPRLAGDLAIWIFILAELLAFGVFFAAYAFARAADPELFALGQEGLNRNAGAFNTLVLLTASYCVVRAVHAAEAGRGRQGAPWLLAALGCGGAFVVVKLAEYSAAFDAGISLSSSTFDMFYLSLTFFHFMHVLLGMVILGALWLNARQGRYDPDNLNGIESGAAYWHMVDLVWLVLFPLVYVMR